MPDPGLSAMETTRRAVIRSVMRDTAFAVLVTVVVMECPDGMEKCFTI
jgi:hypothetical protein